MYSDNVENKSQHVVRLGNLFFFKNRAPARQKSYKYKLTAEKYLLRTPKELV